MNSTISKGCGSPLSHRRTSSSELQEADERFQCVSGFLRPRSGDRSLPYLAVDATEKTDEVCDRLAWIQRREKTLPQKPMTNMLVVLDGAPEFAQNAYRTHRAGTVPPEVLIEAKDGAFYRLCYEVLSLLGARILSGESDWKDEQPETCRPYQDALIGILPFPPEEAVTISVNLQRVLSGRNEKDNKPWPDRMHARIVVGSSWQGVVRNLRYVWRDEIGLDAATWIPLSVATKKCLLTLGVRIVP